jgi:hypothetical protein
MIRDLWNDFPRLLEQKINALLNEAEPTPIKAFQLYKVCQSENLWPDSFEQFSKKIETFFALPRSERQKSHLDALMDRPVSMDVYEGFHLNFRTGLVSSKEVLNIASWAHHLMRLSHKTTSLVISMDVLTKTLQYITSPPLFEKAENIEFDDFCNAWKKTVFKLFGKKYDAELNKILAELQWLHSQIEAKESAPGFVPTIYLTQTEIDWTKSVQSAVFGNESIPKFPLSRGPQKQRLIDLERIIQLYRVVQTTQLPELLKHRDNIRVTILDRCEGLLRERAR